MSDPVTENTYSQEETPQEETSQEESECITDNEKSLDENDFLSDKSDSVLYAFTYHSSSSSESEESYSDEDACFDEDTCSDNDSDALPHKIVYLGSCKKCVVKYPYETCFKCGAIICDKHYDGMLCPLCKYVPSDYEICVICDYPTKPMDDVSKRLTFTINGVFDPLCICGNCQISHIKAMVTPNTYLLYQSYNDVVQRRILKKGNEINYTLIKDGREQIIKFYKNTIPLFILPEVAAIIIDYCGFTREIVFCYD